MKRTCPDCQVELTEIELVVPTGDGGEGWVAWRSPGAKPKRALGLPPTRGRVTSLACPRCARVLLFAVPSVD